ERRPEGDTIALMQDRWRDREERQGTPRAFAGVRVLTILGEHEGEIGRMTTDLRYLAYTAILTAALWIPYIIAQVATNGFLAPPNYVDPTPRPVPLWGTRAHRAYLNAVECFAPFAALVIVAQIAGKADAMTAFWATCYFWLRLAH